MLLMSCQLEFETELEVPLSRKLVATTVAYRIDRQAISVGTSFHTDLRFMGQWTADGGINAPASFVQLRPATRRSYFAAFDPTLSRRPRLSP